jgi:type I restriction enzyme R subunit
LCIICFTGFDAKKLYIGRVIKAHNLLQTLTRVNRTYKILDTICNVVDFADIQKNLTKPIRTNELQSELGG